MFVRQDRRGTAPCMLVGLWLAAAFSLFPFVAAIAQSEEAAQSEAVAQSQDTAQSEDTAQSQDTAQSEAAATESSPGAPSSMKDASSIEDRLNRQRASADTPGARLLAEVSIPFFSVSRFRAEFVQTQEWVGMDDPAFYKGTLFLDRPNKFRIEYAEPAGHLQVCDGKRVYTYVPENEQVLVTYLPEDGRADILGRILEESRPQPEILTDELDGKPVRVLVLEPPLELELAEVRIWTRANSDAILQYELVELSGNRSTYRFLETWDDPEMDPGLFQFTAPPGVPLVEVG